MKFLSCWTASGEAAVNSSAFSTPASAAARVSGRDRSPSTRSTLELAIAAALARSRTNERCRAPMRPGCDHTRADEDDRRRFQQEAQTASSLNHPHILTVFEAGEREGQQYLVTEFIDGGTLGK